MSTPALDPVLQARREARLFWPRVWFYAGLSAAIAEPGEILPFTIAEAGIHVERLPGGGLAARLNMAQQGGCQTVPQQCHGGTQLRCPQMACAFSRDRLPVIGPETPERERLLRQFLGHRPDRLVAVSLWEDAGFLRVRLRDGHGATPDLAAPRFAAQAAQSWWMEAPLPWHRLAHRLVQAAAQAGGTGEVHFPNLVLLARDGWQAAMILQPLGPELTRGRIALAGRAAGDRQAVEDVLVRAVTGTADEAADMEPGHSLRHAIARICDQSPAPGERPARRSRPNPTFGFIGA